MEGRFIGPCVVGLSFGVLLGALTGMIFNSDTINARCRHSGVLFSNSASTTYVGTNLTALGVKDLGIIEYLRYHPGWLVIAIITFMVCWHIADALLNAIGWREVMK